MIINPKEVIPIDITASSKGIQKCSINISYGLLEMLLNHTVKLERLSRCNLECPITMFISNLVHDKPLFGRAYTSR